jgi:hypothetical protein
MHHSGKFIAACSTAVSVAALFGAALLPVLEDAIWPRTGITWIEDQLQILRAEVNTDESGSGRLEAPSESLMSQLEKANGGRIAKIGTDRGASGADRTTSASNALSPSAPGLASTESTQVALSVPPLADIWSKAEITMVLKECLRLLAPLTATDVEPLPPIHSGECGTAAPALLRSSGTSHGGAAGRNQLSDDCRAPSLAGEKGTTSRIWIARRPNCRLILLLPERL